MASLYHGRKVLYGEPRHPYSNALLSAILNTGKERAHRRVALAGEDPVPRKPSERV